MLTLEHLFPSTIHPMVVHFTIAIIYMAGIAGIMSLIYRKSDFFVKIFWLMLVLSFLATIAAGAAGIISESYISHYPTGAASMLSNHREYAIITGVFVSIGLLFQTWKSYITLEKMLPSWISVVATILAVVFVSLTGHLGGTVVYHFGVGVS